MSIDEVKVEISIDGLDLTEEEGGGDQPTAPKEDSLEGLRKDLEELRNEFAASEVDAEARQKEIDELQDTVEKLRERLDEWDGSAQKRQELLRRLIGTEEPSTATRRKMAIG